jgi:hypothetical protein
MLMKNGVFCISIDTELLWGRKDLDYSKFIDKVKKERSIIRKVLNLFKKYNIPVTWAIVGKLYEEGDELWSGIDIINLIKKEKIHELASHSYSHEDFSKIDKKTAILEFSKPKAFSFVFPRNHIKYLSLLKKAGFKAYRGIDESNSKKHFIQLINLLFSVKPKTAIPIKKNGLIEIPSSMYFVSNRGPRKYIPYGLRMKRAKLGIDRAIIKNEIFHLWLHPIDLVDNSTNLLNEFEEILKYAYIKRRESFLKIETMQQITKNHEKSLE